MPYDVFISYATKDKMTADAVCAGLEAMGIRCWIAPRDLAPGQQWAEGIVQVIDQTRLMVLIFSAHANTSRYVISEVTLAADNNLVIIPFRIENTKPEGSLKFHLSTPHWLDALSTPLEAHIRHLGEQIAVTLNKSLTSPFSTKQMRDTVNATDSHQAQKPTIKFLPEVDGREVKGAKVSDGETTWDIPIVLSVEHGAKYHFKITYNDSTGKAYASELKVIADWSGEQISRVSLIAVTCGSAPIRTVQGGDEEISLTCLDDDMPLSTENWEDDTITLTRKAMLTQDVPCLDLTSADRKVERAPISLILPHDSCPCGSGKEYKVCCGK